MARIPPIAVTWLRGALWASLAFVAFAESRGTAQDGGTGDSGVRAAPPAAREPSDNRGPASPRRPGLAAKRAKSAVTPPVAPALPKQHAPPLAEAPAPVRVGETVVVTLRLPRAGRSAAQRALSATQALDGALEEHRAIDTKVAVEGDAATIFVGKTPVLTLFSWDASLDGRERLEVYAASVAARMRKALRDERERLEIAGRVFAVSMVVLSGLLAFLLLRRLGLLLHRARHELTTRSDTLAGLKVREIEVVEPNALRSALSIALGVGHKIAYGVVLYSWLAFSLSLFTETSGYTKVLTGLVVEPFSSTLGRVGAALPVFVVVALLTVAVALFVRFVGLFFASVARGDTEVTWLNPDLAHPAGVVIQVAIALLALLFVVPLFVGKSDPAFGRIGSIALFAISLACTPSLANIVVGLGATFSRRIRPGMRVCVGDAVGRVLRVTLLDVRIETDLGGEECIPHLVTLFRPTRIEQEFAQTFDVVVSPREDVARVQRVLRTATREVCSRFEVKLLRLDDSGARYRISGLVSEIASEHKDLATSICAALVREGIALGVSQGQKT